MHTSSKPFLLLNEKPTSARSRRIETQPRIGGSVNTFQEVCALYHVLETHCSLLNVMTVLGEDLWDGGQGLEGAIRLWMRGLSDKAEGRLEKPYRH